MERSVWAKGKSEEKNIALAFLYDIPTNRGDEIKISVSASNVYKMFVADTFLGYGPARAAHGYARIDEYTFTATANTTYLTFEVASYRVNSFNFINEQPFFDCDVYVNGKLYATSLDAKCYELTDRVIKVQRYSYQRPFIEVYKPDQCRTALYLRTQNVFPNVETEEVENKRYLPRGVRYPQLTDTAAFAAIEQGSMTVDENKPLYRDRAFLSIGEHLLGFSYDELEDKVSDTVSRFVYHPNAAGENAYVLYDAGKEYSGLIKAKVAVKKDCVLYFLFDEILWDEEEGNAYLNGEKNLSFSRLKCCNAVKYTLKAGTYNLQSFEPYSFRYIKTVCVGGEAEIEELKLTRIENPGEAVFEGKIADKDSDDILQAAFRTYKQNTLDVLMDCPSRERAGWTNDSYFACKADLLFSGKAYTEKNFLENLLLLDKLPQLPEGMMPMCYPCDHLDGEFIPNCGMWVAMEMCERALRFPEEGYAEKIKEKAYATIRYFEEFENEDGLIESLKHWIFIEWSICNTTDYIAGVNYPSNMMYYGLVKRVGEVFGDTALLKKAAKMKETIRAQSFNGEMFEDNRIRENGKLTLQGHISETCQYYAFFFDIADKESDPILYEKMFGKERRQLLAEMPDMPESNVIVGLIMRMELLMRYGLQNILESECKELFSKMAKRTATLWENNGIYASCNHGLVAIAAVWLAYVYTGYRGVENGKIVLDKTYVGTDCSWAFSYDGKPIRIEVKGGKRTVVSEYQVEEKNIV
ncbi:MAG: hypothetical protein IJX87_01660 [Clostridia bacterium]|nr:hypothetical protein [Clostridia bacterium]